MLYRKTTSIVLFGLFILCKAAYAGSLNYRHEYVDNGYSKDRIAISNTFKNGIGISIEAKFKSVDNNQPLSNLLSNGHEEQISWKKNLTPTFCISPSFSIESNSGESIYKPKFSIKYNLNNHSYLATSYKLEYHKTPSTTVRTNDRVGKYDLLVGYSFGKYQTEFDYTYAKSFDQKIRTNNKDYSVEYNEKIAYVLNNAWAPFIEIGNIGVKNSDKRLTRMRIGVNYNF